MTASLSAPSTRDGRPIAGWMLKGAPDLFDAVAAFERVGEVRGWSLNPTYRVALVAAGQPCFLYITGGGPHGHRDRG